MCGVWFQKSVECLQQVCFYFLKMQCPVDPVGSLSLLLVNRCVRLHAGTKSHPVFVQLQVSVDQWLCPTTSNNMRLGLLC